MDGSFIGRIGATSVGPRFHLARTWAHGRVCAEPNCGVVLSVYNPQPWCAVHHSFETLRLVVAPRYETGSRPLSRSNGRRSTSLQHAA